MLNAGGGVIVSKIATIACGLAGAIVQSVCKLPFRAEGDTSIIMQLSEIVPFLGAEFHACLTPIISEVASRTVIDTFPSKVICIKVRFGVALGYTAMGGVVSEKGKESALLDAGAVGH